MKKIIVGLVLCASLCLSLTPASTVNVVKAGWGVPVSVAKAGWGVPISILKAGWGVLISIG